MARKYKLDLIEFDIEYKGRRIGSCQARTPQQAAKLAGNLVESLGLSVAGNVVITCDQPKEG